MTPSTFDHKWNTTVAIWRGNAWLFGVAGWLLGLLTLPALSLITADAANLLGSLVPEAVGIMFTVAVIERFNRQREARRQREEALRRIIREMASPSAEDGARAAREALDRGMLTDGSLRGADLRRANLSGVNLEGAVLSGADAKGADFSSTNLKHVNLSEADMKGVNLSGANVYQADLRRAQLWDANLSAAALHGSDLRGAALGRADLRGTDLRGVNLAGANLKGATLDENTTLPDSPPARRRSRGGHTRTWTPTTDMTRYTDPNHPDFWQPDWAKKGNDNPSG